MDPMKIDGAPALISSSASSGDRMPPPALMGFWNPMRLALLSHSTTSGNSGRPDRPRRPSARAESSECRKRRPVDTLGHGTPRDRVRDADGVAAGCRLCGVDVRDRHVHRKLGMSGYAERVGDVERVRNLVDQILGHGHLRRARDLICRPTRARNPGRCFLKQGGRTRRNSSLRSSAVFPTDMKERKKAWCVAASDRPQTEPRRRETGSSPRR